MKNKMKILSTMLFLSSILTAQSYRVEIDETFYEKCKQDLEKEEKEITKELVKNWIKEVKTINRMSCHRKTKEFQSSSDKVINFYFVKHPNIIVDCEKYGPNFQTYCFWSKEKLFDALKKCCAKNNDSNDCNKAYTILKKYNRT